MKFMVILLLVAAVHANDVQQRAQNFESEKTEKRLVSKGNSIRVSVEKRTPAISTVSPAITPGVEYADSKESQQDKSPTHQIYATPLPNHQPSKISDVFAGQGPSFQSAIASHLFAPVSVYQQGLGSPTTYEVSAPVPSNLAYAEHRVSLQPVQNALQFNEKPLQKHKNLQQVLIQQPLSYPQEGQIGQAVYQQLPQVQYQDFANQFQVPLYSGQQPVYQGQPLQITQNVQPSLAYSLEPQQAQRELKPQQESKTAEKQVAAQNVQPKGAVSFTKFSQVQPMHLQPQQEVQYHQQPQVQQQLLQYQQPQVQLQQLQYQPQQPQFQVVQQPQFQVLQQPQYQRAQQYQVIPQIQAVQYQLQPEQVQQHSQPQIQYQSQPQLQQKFPVVPLPQTQHLPLPQPQPQLVQPQYQAQYQPQYQPQYQSHQQQYQTLPQQQYHVQPVSKATNVEKASFLRPGPEFHQSQYPQSQEALDYRNNVAVPANPTVQYFGKYAQSIFGDSQH